ncbi:hypothetical protein LINPERHAP1_LOCUS26440 [Linum perenne]
MAEERQVIIDQELLALQSLAIDDDALVFPDEDDNQVAWGYEYCLVGWLLTNKQYNLNALKNLMASIWQPGRGLQVQDIGDKLILFRFFHEKDVRWVMTNGP